MTLLERRWTINRAIQTLYFCLSALTKKKTTTMSALSGILWSRSGRSTRACLLRQCTQTVVEATHCCMSTHHLVHYALLLTPACWKSNNTNARLMASATFSCFGPHIWNSLPQDLKHCSALSSFKAELKTFVFSQYFYPN